MTRDYALDEYGMMFGKEEFDYLAEMFHEDKDDWDFLADKIEMQRTTNFTGEANIIGEDGFDSVNYQEFDENTIYYFPLQKIGSLFHAPYSNIDEIVLELKENWGEYLPNNYNFKNKICHIVGTYYG